MEKPASAPKQKRTKRQKTGMRTLAMQLSKPVHWSIKSLMDSTNEHTGLVNWRTLARKAKETTWVGHVEFKVLFKPTQQVHPIIIQDR